MTQRTPCELSLLSQCAHKKSVIDYQKDQLDFLMETFFPLVRDTFTDQQIWDFLESDRFPWKLKYKQVESYQIGVLSVIKPYTNLKGKTFDAHFKKCKYAGNQYIGPVSSLGAKPISYTTYDMITKDRYMIQRKGATSLQTLFYPDPEMELVAYKKK